MTSSAVHITWGHRVARGWSEPFWRLDGVRPAITCNTSFPAENGAPGQPTPPASAAGIGDQLHGWYRHYADELDALGVDYGARGWAFIAAHIGGYEGGVTKAIFGTSADYVTGLTTGRDTSPLRAGGLAAARDVAAMAFGRLAELLRDAGEPAPAYLPEDDEHKPYALDAHLWTPKLIDGTEPRGSSEILFDGRSFLDLYNSRLRGDGSAVTGGVPTESGWWQQAAYRGFYYWVTNLVWEVADAARVYVKKDVARMMWPSIIYSNYEDVAGVRGSVTPWDYYWNVREYNRRTRGRGSAPVLYPIQQYQFIDQTWGSVLQWCTAMGVEPIGNGTVESEVVATLRAISVARAKKVIDEAAAANAFFGVSDPITVWMPTTDFFSQHGLVTGYWYLTAADIREIALHAVAAGVRVFIWWWNDISPTVLSTTASDNMAALIAEINTATEVSLPDPPAPPPSRMARRMTRLAGAHVRRFGTTGLTITEHLNGTLNPATGKRNTTVRSVSVQAVRRPVAAEQSASGNDRRTIDSVDFVVTAADLAAAVVSDGGPAIVPRRGLKVTDDDLAVYTVALVDRETDRNIIVLRCQRG